MPLIFSSQIPTPKYTETRVRVARAALASAAWVRPIRHILYFVRPRYFKSDIFFLSTLGPLGASWILSHSAGIFDRKCDHFYSYGSMAKAFNRFKQEW